jgi:hypothetical protein
MMAMLDDHHPVAVVMMPALIMPATIAMAAEFVTRAVMVAVPDYNVLRTRNGRRRDSKRANGGNDVSKLLHIVLLH